MDDDGVREAIVTEHGDSGGVAASGWEVIIEFNISEFVGSVVKLISSERKLGTRLPSCGNLRDRRPVLHQ